MRFAITFILSAAVLVLFSGLGIWQLQRLDWKADVLAQIDARIGAAPIDLPVSPDPVQDRFLPIILRGNTGDIRRVLASTRDLGAVHRIIQAVQLEDSDLRVLVDMGVVPVGAVFEPVQGVPVVIIGNLHWPDEVDTWTPLPDLDAGLFYARDIDALAAALNTEKVLVVAREITPPQAEITPLPVTSQGIPNRHLEYAVTWFLLAMTWAVMTGYALWRKKRQTL